MPGITLFKLSERDESRGLSGDADGIFLARPRHRQAFFIREREITAMRQLRARMTARQRRFIAEYVVDLNATKAAIRAGYSERGAGQKAWQMLHWRPAIAEAIAQALKAREQRLMVSADHVVRQLARIAFADIRQLVRRDEKGEVVRTPLDEIGEDLQAAIAEIQWSEKGVRIRLADRRAALDSLARHLGFSGRLRGSTPLRPPDQLPAREILRRKLAALAGEGKDGAAAPSSPPGEGKA